MPSYPGYPDPYSPEARELIDRLYADMRQLRAHISTLHRSYGVAAVAMLEPTTGLFIEIPIIDAQETEDGYLIIINPDADLIQP
jgi:hypothetical protein